MFSRLPGALMRAVLFAWMIATPCLMLTGVPQDTIETTVLFALVAAALVLAEYGSAYPSFVEFRHAPPFNRLRFLACFLTVIALTLICRGVAHPTTITVLLSELGGMAGRLMDLPYSPVRNAILMLPAESTAQDIELTRSATGLAYLASIAAVLFFIGIMKWTRWPRQIGDFNIYINLPTFDPTVGGDVVERLYRDARLNVALGLVLPFLLPAVAVLVSSRLGGLLIDSPHTLIWTVAIWSFIPTSLIMRGIAMSRVAQLIEEKRRRRYAEFGEDGAYA